VTGARTSPGWKPGPPSAPVLARIPSGALAADSRSCIVVEGDERRPGTVLAWQRSEDGWRGLVRFARKMPEGYPLNYEYWLPADVLEPV
jgi:hypothetical protein